MRKLLAFYCWIAAAISLAGVLGSLVWLAGFRDLTFVRAVTWTLIAMFTSAVLLSGLLARDATFDREQMWLRGCPSWARRAIYIFGALILLAVVVDAATPVSFWPAPFLVITLVYAFVAAVHVSGARVYGGDWMCEYGHPVSGDARACGRCGARAHDRFHGVP